MFGIQPKSSAIPSTSWASCLGQKVEIQNSEHSVPGTHSHTITTKNNIKGTATLLDM